MITVHERLVCNPRIQAQAQAQKGFGCLMHRSFKTSNTVLPCCHYYALHAYAVGMRIGMRIRLAVAGWRVRKHFITSLMNHEQNPDET